MILAIKVVKLAQITVIISVEAVIQAFTITKNNVTPHAHLLFPLWTVLQTCALILAHLSITSMIMFVKKLAQFRLSWFKAKMYASQNSAVKDITLFLKNKDVSLVTLNARNVKKQAVIAKAAKHFIFLMDHPAILNVLRILPF